MGKRSQERMTGKTHEARLHASQGLLPHLAKQIRRLNKPAPTRFANVRRSGIAHINPKLMKRRGKRG